MRLQRAQWGGKLRVSSSGADVAALPRLGLGVGLRSSHFSHITRCWPKVDWFEAISENFMDSGGRPGHVIRQVAERYPVVLHGVSLSIGSTDPLDRDYLRRLKRLADDIRAVWVSDHLCWTGVAGTNSHDLLPLPLNEDTLRHVCNRVHQVQDELQRPIILENPSTYIKFKETTLSEPSFLHSLAEETGCGLLLDVNNVYVSCFNAGSDPLEYLKSFPFDRVVQMHLAGHQHCGSHIIDTHDQPVSAAVWELFRYAWRKSGGVSTLLEWDGDVPDFDRVHQEVLAARDYMQGALRPLPQAKPGKQGEIGLSNPVDFLVPEVAAASSLASA